MGSVDSVGGSSTRINTRIYVILFRESERAVIVFAIPKASIDETHELDSGTEREAVVRLAEDVLVEDIAQSLFAYAEARDEYIVAAQRCLVLQLSLIHI